MQRTEAEQKLRQLFGIDHFYDEQWKAVSRLLAGERILMIERTGFGKSLCYQFPATQFPGLTIVFSPLIALMRDQVRGLLQKGIKAAYVNSEQLPEENREVIERALRGEYKILYIAPERQENRDWIEAVKQMNLSMVVIDEAHTISTWGHDFRPAFRRIVNLVKLLPSHLPVLATTATATSRVQHDIERQIGGNLTTIRGSLTRPNFKLWAVRVQSEEEKMIWLAKCLNRLPGTGLIYSGTRTDTMIYTHWLQFAGVDAVGYNAGFDPEKRKKIERGLMENRWKCIVSTNALGMGIDKPDIRFVIHTQIPVSPILYYQEIGRAGRDGQPTFVILFYNEAPTRVGDEVMAHDATLPRSFIDTARPPKAKYEKVIELLQEEPLTESAMARKANIKLGQTRIIKYDLIDQGIIKEVERDGKKTFEYQYGAPRFDYSAYEAQRREKLRDLEQMEAYVYTAEPRMKFLCNYLDSNEETVYANCDNTTLKPFAATLHDPFYSEKLREFRDTFFPELEVCGSDYRRLKDDLERSYSLKLKVPYPGVYEVARGDEPARRYEECIPADDFTEPEYEALQEMLLNGTKKRSQLTNGVAGSYYGVSHVGSIIHKCKYEGGGDFPDSLLTLTLKAFNTRFGHVSFDMLLFVPPTVSGTLVANFARKFAAATGIPLCDRLVKLRSTQEQKIFQNSYGKRENVREAFDIDDDAVAGKNIVLIDDIYDSGVTIKEIGRMLTLKGANMIVPVVIAKTVGGTIL